MMLHLGDTYTFWAEMIQQQPTSQEEAEIFAYQRIQKKDGQRKYGRLALAGVMFPFAYSCAAFYGRWWKLGAFCVIYILRNAIYDSGMFIRFFIYGPNYLSKIMAQD